MNASRRARRLVGCLVRLLAWGAPVHGEEVEASHRKRLANPAAALAREEQEADARLRANPRDAQSFRARGLARLNLGRWDEAAADLSRAAALNPSQAGVKAELAFALMLNGR